MLATRPADRLYDGDAVVEALRTISEGRMPTLHPEGFHDGGTTDIGDIDEEFEDAETEGDLSPSPVQYAHDDPRANARKPRVRRRRR
jgi:hypothetical protein